MKHKSIKYSKTKGYYFNIYHHRWMKHIPGTWDNGPLIYKVPLFPEQAVLSCCTNTPNALRFQGATFCIGSGAAPTRSCNDNALGKTTCDTGKTGYLCGSSEPSS